MIKQIIQKGDWMISIDLKDAYFMVPIDHHHRKFPEIQMGERDLRVPGGPLWVEECSSSLHKADETHYGSSSAKINASKHIFGRSPSGFEIQRGMSRSETLYSPAVQEVGLVGELGEVPSGPLPPNPVFGAHHRFQRHGVEASRGEDQTPRDLVQGDNQKAPSISGSIGQHSPEDECHFRGCSPGSNFLQGTPSRPYSGGS